MVPVSSGSCDSMGEPGAWTSCSFGLIVSFALIVSLASIVSFGSIELEIFRSAVVRVGKIELHTRDRALRLVIGLNQKVYEYCGVVCQS